MVSRHRDMMENRIVGCDVLPSHVHLTASSLAGLHIREKFDRTRLYIMPYGAGEGFDGRADAYEAAMDKVRTIRKRADDLKRRAAEEASPQKKAALAGRMAKDRAEASKIRKGAAPDNPINHVRCGSVEMLDFTQTRLDAFDISSSSILAAAGGGTDAPVSSMDVRRGSCDIVVMNPPFLSAANPEQKSDDVHNPAFAGFDASPRAQDAMGKRAAAIAAGKLARMSSGRRAGKIQADREKITSGGKLPVYFAHIADMMLRKGGALALVLPLAFAQGESWRTLREKVVSDYDDILVVSAAGNTADESSFSASTGMREVVLMARKAPKTGPEKRVSYVVLRRVPRDPLMAGEIGRQVRSIVGRPPPDILAGPGPRLLRVGGDEVGSAVSAMVSAGPNPSFPINAVLDMSLAVAATRLGGGLLCLGPGIRPVKIGMTVMDEIGEGGLLSRDIDGCEILGDKTERGPFVFAEETSCTQYPGVNRHDKDAQSSMKMEPDGYYVPKENAKSEQVEAAWKKSGRVIIATHWRFNTQPCVSGYVGRAVLGGAAFPNFILHRRAHEKPFVVWQNSVFGAMCFWLHSTRQHMGRGIVSKELRRTMPVLDFGALGEKQLGAMSGLFERYHDKEFLSLDRLPDDAHRRAMDTDLFGVLAGRAPSRAEREGIGRLHAALSAEPTVVG